MSLSTASYTHLSLSKANFPSARYEHISTSSQHKQQIGTSESQILAALREENFLADDALRMTYTFGSISTTEACARMAEKLIVFEQTFNKGGSKG